MCPELKFSHLSPGPGAGARGCVGEQGHPSAEVVRIVRRNNPGISSPPPLDNLKTQVGGCLGGSIN